MIELKVRAYSKNVGMWDEITHIAFKDGKIVHIRGLASYHERERQPIGGHADHMDIEDIILMRYTGLKDKKRTEEYPEGQELYEEDIIETYVRNNGGLDNVWIKVRAVVVFKYSRWWGDIRWREEDRGTTEIELVSYKMDAIEIIGNMFENKELVK